MKSVFLDQPSDCQWLRETHLKQSNLLEPGQLPAFRSFILYGDESGPDVLECHRYRCPKVTDKPCFRAIYQPDESKYKLEFPV